LPVDGCDLISGEAITDFLDDKKKAGYLDQKSDIENQKNEKLEGKLKLDIKKTENSSKSEKDRF
jgi:hypothetical protein